MNKTKSIIAVTFFGLILAMALTRPASKPDRALEMQPSPTPTSISDPSISLLNTNYAFTYWVARPDKSQLIANFDDQENATKLLTINNCSAGINGSFYDEKISPLAWWEANSDMRKKVTHNNLLNGFVSVNQINDLKISKIKVDEPVKWGMQSGPVLVSDGIPETLQMAIDKPARRSVIGRDKIGNLVILSIFGMESKLDGPNLEELPKVVQMISNQEKLEIEDAINLDGGAASVFMSPKISISEMVLVGSVICLKN